MTAPDAVHCRSDGEDEVHAELRGRPLKHSSGAGLAQGVRCPKVHPMKTPLYEAHVALGARMAPFAGWDMPIQYEGIIPEHLHTRARCGVFDTCHMGEFELRGATAESDLERLLTTRVSNLAVGQCRYAYLLNERGGVLDDLTCYRFAPDRFWLVVNAGPRASDADWVRTHCSPATVFEDRSEALAKLDVQGPLSRQVMEQAFETVLPELGYFRFAEVKLNGVPCVLSRTGYTGEWGYELYFPAEHAVPFWERLLATPGAQPVGLGARDTLRLEMGYPLYGHELTADRTPAGVAGGRFLDLARPFIGRDIVRAELERGPRERLVGLTLEGRRAGRAGARVWWGEDIVGVVTSGSYAPSLGRAVALALVSSECAVAGTALEIEVTGGRLRASVADLPFYRQGTARGVVAQPAPGR